MKLTLCTLLAGVALAAVSCSDTPSNVVPYQLSKCIVSDEKLGSMGDPYVFIHEGYEIKLCCEGCRKDFMESPANYMVKLLPPPPVPTLPVK